MDIYRQKMNFDLNVAHYTKINSKQTLDLNVKHKAINLLGKTIGEKKLESRGWQKVLRFDIKNMRHKRKN